ncbi:hypothetical protein AAE478_009500 [Parahypoxylon ruwenzoriense]
MGKPREFPKFMSLPPELRDMVWKYHAENLKLGVHHYFGVNGSVDWERKSCRTRKGRVTKDIASPVYERSYTCIDMYREAVINAWATRLDPTNTRLGTRSLTKFQVQGAVQHTYDIGTKLEAGELFEELVPRRPRRQPRRHSPFIMADFERDVFIFGVNYSFRKKPNVFMKFLTTPVSRLDPRNLPDGHWFFNIRKLGLRQHIPSGVYSKSIVPGWVYRSAWRSLHPFDANCLSRMTNLEVLYVIFSFNMDHGCSYDESYDALQGGLDENSFLPSSEFRRLFRRHEKQCKYRDSPPQKNLTYYEYHLDSVDAYSMLLSDIKKVFRNRPNPPKIELVMDPCEIFGLKHPESGEDSK